MKHKVIAESLVNMGNVCSSNNNNKVRSSTLALSEIMLWRQLPSICDTRNICLYIILTIYITINTMV